MAMMTKLLGTPTYTCLKWSRVPFASGVDSHDHDDDADGDEYGDVMLLLMIDSRILYRPVISSLRGVPTSV